MVRDTGQDLEPGRGESGDCGRGQSRLAWTGEIAVAVVVLSGLAGVALWSGTALDATATQARLLYSDFAGTRQARDLEWQIQASRRQFLSTTPPAGDRAAEAALGKARFESAIAALHARQKALDEDAGRRRSAVEGGIENVVIADALFLPVALAGMVGLWLRRRRRNHALQVLSLRHRERGSASGWERERNGVLELIGTNQPLELICDAIVAIVESRHAHVSCGIAVVRKGSLRFLSARRLSTTVVHALSSVEGMNDGSPFQRSFHSGKAVIVESISTDPLWEGMRKELAEAGFVSSWSLPLQSNSGYSLGAITLFAEANDGESGGYLASLEMAAGMASLAVQHRKVHEQLAYQAQHDSVTELPNRVLFQEKVANAIAAAVVGGSVGFAVVLLDLDDFKQVNDTLGHTAGDALLRQVAHRLRRFVRTSDTVARLGGDEFAILLNQIGNYGEAEVVVDKILEALRAPLRLPGKPVVLTASIGVSVHPEDGRDAATLLKNADMAMYRAKRAGKDKAQRFLQRMADEMNDQMEMDSRLRTALANREFSVFYQPELRPDGSIAAFEALLRWDSPTLGKVPPMQFIPVAERSGLIVPIGTWVLREACRQCVAWQKASLPELRIAVNMSVVQLEQQDVAATVRDVLLETGLDPACLQLEITESYLVRDAAEAKVQLRSLRSLGLKIAIDDFGTGYSSLSYLRHLPVDTLKIDRSFILDVASSARSRSVVQAIIGMAHGLSMEVVAEGVETRDQLDVLTNLNCNLLQGYLFSRPLPICDLNLRVLSQRYAEVLDALLVAS
jgi:diguanylate cyclase (GGDEF)-like protein